MSLFGTLNTAVSGMSAQANMLGTIGDNIANSGTTGYKQATIDFETQLGTQSATSYTAGGVQSAVRYGIGDQGTLTSTTSSTDLAVQGNGFFVVQNANGGTALTRAGSFVPNAAGNLVNTAGYELMGYNLTDGSSATANGVGGLQVINLSKQSLSASPSTTGTLGFNVSSNATAVTGDTPASNAADATYTSKTSVAAYDDLGNQVTLDVYLTKTGDNTWEATTYNQADAASGGGFPYASAALSSQTLVYDGTTGKLDSVGGAATPLDLSVPIPNGKTLSIDVGQSTQLAARFQCRDSHDRRQRPKQARPHHDWGGRHRDVGLCERGRDAQLPHSARQRTESRQHDVASGERLRAEPDLGQHDRRRSQFGQPRLDPIRQPRELDGRSRDATDGHDHGSAELRGELQSDHDHVRSSQRGQSTDQRLNLGEHRE